MSLKTSSSPVVPGRPRQGCFPRRPAGAATLAVLLVALAVSGCGSSGGPDAGAITTAASAPAQTTTAAAPTTTAAPRTTAIAQSRPRRPKAHHRRAARPAHTTPTAPAAASTGPAASAPAPQQQPTSTASRPAEPVAHAVDEVAHLVLVSSPAPGSYVQQGTVTGTFEGTMTLKAHVTDAGIAVEFTADVAGGTVSGHGLAIPTIVGGSSTATLSGTASITGGTGKFAHVRGSRLKVSGTTVLPSGARATVHMTGTVTW